jgi:hypothetical protein
MIIDKLLGRKRCLVCDVRVKKKSMTEIQYPYTDNSGRRRLGRAYLCEEHGFLAEDLHRFKQHGRDDDESV